MEAPQVTEGPFLSTPPAPTLLLCSAQTNSVYYTKPGQFQTVCSKGVEKISPNIIHKQQIETITICQYAIIETMKQQRIQNMTAERLG